jgi:hypothetical protein
MYNYSPYFNKDDGSCISKQSVEDINKINMDSYNGRLTYCANTYPNGKGGLQMASTEEGRKCSPLICKYAMCDPSKNEMLSLWRNQNIHGAGVQSPAGGYGIKNGSLGSIIDKCIRDYPTQTPGCALPVKNDLNNSSIPKSNRIPICNIVSKGDPERILRRGAYSMDKPVCGASGCDLTQAATSNVQRILLNQYDKGQVDQIKEIFKNPAKATGACYN